MEPLPSHIVIPESASEASRFEILEIETINPGSEWRIHCQDEVECGVDLVRTTKRAKPNMLGGSRQVFAFFINGRPFG
jgi:hypothetical protein